MNKNHLWLLCFRLIVMMIVMFADSMIPNGEAQRQQLRVHFLDVGYGDAIVIQLPNGKTVVIDAGPEETSRRMIEYLDALDIDTIDTIIITHPHKNHFEGFISIKKHWPINEVFINGDVPGEDGYYELLESFKKREIPIKILKRGDTLTSLSKEIEFRILHPFDLSGSVNGNSLVVWLQYRKISILLMADVELKEIREVIEDYPEIKSAQCVTVPHHGTFIGEKFAETFQDKIFIISTGKNPYGEIDPKEVERLKGKVYRTDLNGTIIVESDGQTIKVLP